MSLAAGRVRIGVDLGGSKIETAAFAPDGRPLSRRRRATPESYTDTLRAIAALVQAVEQEAGEAGAIGVGIPGSPNPTSGLVRNANSTRLNGRPLAADLAAALGRPVRLANDADCFALSEAVDGAGAGAGVVFGVILGTGVGGGVVVEGRLLSGAQAIAGEWGHNPLPWARDDERPGPACWCGKQGCLETWLSGPGLARDHVGAGGEPLTAQAIAARARAGDAPPAATLARHADRLARGLASVLNVIDAHVVVLGGGLSNIEGLAEAAAARLPAWLFSDHVATKVRRNVHGDASGVRGAAWLWPLEGEER